MVRTSTADGCGSVLAYLGYWFQVAVLLRDRPNSVTTARISTGALGDAASGREARTAGGSDSARRRCTPAAVQNGRGRNTDVPVPAKRQARRRGHGRDHGEGIAFTAWIRERLSAME